MQLRFEAVDLTAGIPSSPHNSRLSWLLRNLIDTESFQRLRFIRQNGLANLVFHGAEHSRFNHSMGVLYLARTMYHKIVRNMDLPASDIDETSVTAAALLHDVGHGPFSHTMEHILEEFDVSFDHEEMTKRIISEWESEVNKKLVEYDKGLPSLLVPFFDKKKRTEDSWIYKVVSSQLDGDRLDYLLRDALFAGVHGPSFDIHRLLDLLHCHEGKRIAVERCGIEAVEAYLVTLDQMYRNVYYHHAVRAAAVVLTSTIRRAVELDLNGDKSVFPAFGGAVQHPLKRLIKDGDEVPLSIYERLNDSSIWALVEGWREHDDLILQDLARRLYSRRLFKTLNFVDLRPSNTTALVQKAKDLTKKLLPHLDDSTVEYYVIIDESTRTSYKGYLWTPESWDDSIWLVGGTKKPEPIEDERESTILDGLRRQRYFDRLVVHEDVRSQLTS
jgi:hypothetical protein